ncbi:MAG: MurR/RpiR family transcriptional regulator [Hyphomicrobiales bacterium]|nr:MurR/RpiR family transcriptional regulator [Hyphomicrobiales bacterium]
MEYGALSIKLSQSFSTLSPQLRQAARHVSSRPDDVALMSMRALADEAGVHPSTMVRLAQALGFRGYREFRRPFQERLRVRPRGYLARARDLQGREDRATASLLAEVAGAAETNLKEAFGRNSPEQFARAAAALAGAARIFVVGQRGSYPIGFYFHYAYSMFRGNAVLVDGRGGTFADELRSLTGADAVLALSSTPYGAETVRAVAFARDRGATVVAITDNRVSPLAKNADHTLLASIDSPSFFQSAVAAMATAEALVLLILAGAGGEALRAIADSERQLDKFRAYWRDGE